MHRAIALVLSLMVSVAVLAQAVTPVMTVPSVDLERYLGDWYEVARYPNWFQRSCTGEVRATYARRTDGRLDVINRCQTADAKIKEARGVARVEDRKTFARLKVRFAPAALSFMPFVWGDYWILGLDADYAWAVVGSPDRKYLWVLSRSQILGDTQWDRAMAAVKVNGFDEARLVRTSHKPAGTIR